MDVILLERVRNLGSLGEKVKVKRGYGRNYLIPQRKAVPATTANLKHFEAKRAELEKAAEETFRQAERRAAAIVSLAQVRITARAADEGKLYGSIGAHEIAKALQNAGQAVERKEVLLPNGALRQVGEYDIALQLHSDIMTTIKVVIVAE